MSDENGVSAIGGNVQILDHHGSQLGSAACAHSSGVSTLSCRRPIPSRRGRVRYMHRSQGFQPHSYLWRHIPRASGPTPHSAFAVGEGVG